MSILEVIFSSPGTALGCVIGAGCAAGLHWLLPQQDIVFVQSLLVLGGCAAGFIAEALISWRNSKR